MPEANPLTIFVAENAQLAEAVVKLLASSNIAAEAVAESPRVETEPLTGMTELNAGGDIEIRVIDPKQVTAAKELLDSAAGAAMLKAVREKRANRTGTVVAECEDCGKSSEWPAAVMGTTEICPHCTGYMDILDPDDDWSGVDFGSEDEEEEKE